MPLINVRGYLPGTGHQVIIVVKTENVSFMSPCPGCNLVQVHCCGSFFETDRIGTNLILNAMKDEFEEERDIRISAGYENVIDW